MEICLLNNMEQRQNIFYKRFDGPKKGYCSICDEYKELTFDHIPPKACGNTNVEIKHFFNIKNKIKAPRGLMFRTICKECNNMLCMYDEILAKISKEINGYLNSSIITFGNIKMNGNIEDIKKCIIGHLLAGFDSLESANKPHYMRKGEFRFIFRDFLFGIRPLPDDFIIGIIWEVELCLFHVLDIHQMLI